MNIVFQANNPNFVRLTLEPGERNEGDAVVNMLPVRSRGPNYSKYCTGFLEEDEKPRSIRDCVFQYTSGPNWFCSEVNIALASDSPSLKNYGMYIKQLKYSITRSPMSYRGLVYRGLFQKKVCISSCIHKSIFHSRSRFIENGARGT